ncbi:hypothetical protein BTHE68_30190 [Burkholderia sp. THE68]|jgi:hypothetical protein|nr:hypothetical protein BTHE68_30190 [Burkholderia sp. THE68]BCQ25126.1 hypothetical protein NK8_33030 [Caballeronia sp. NK8]
MRQTYKGYILPTPEEEAEIQRGIELDPDTWNLSYDDFLKLKISPRYQQERSMASEPSAA